MRALDNPAEYALSKEDVAVISLAQVSQQSMSYESHDEARLDFQHLNDGIGLIPYEKYRGDLERDDAGRELYAAIRNTVDSLSVSLAGLSRSSEHGRKKAGQLHRNSLGLFFQYAKGHRDLQLYAKSERSLNDQIERRVRAWLDENMDSWKDRVQAVIRTLERVNALLSEKTKSHPARRWDLTAVRAMYSANIYCKNVGCVSDVFDGLVNWFVACNVQRKTWSARYEVLVEGTPVTVRMDQASLKWLDRVQSAGGPAVVVSKRTRNYVAPAGFDDSHVTPHADGGTETIIEPSISNRARGRRPIEGITEAH
jgi:hypothetical protein